MRWFDTIKEHDRRVANLLTGQLGGRWWVRRLSETQPFGGDEIAMSVGMGLWRNPMRGCGQRTPSSSPARTGYTATGKWQ